MIKMIYYKMLLAFRRKPVIFCRGGLKVRIARDELTRMYRFETLNGGPIGQRFSYSGSVEAALRQLNSEVDDYLKALSVYRAHCSWINAHVLHRKAISSPTVQYLKLRHNQGVVEIENRWPGFLEGKTTPLYKYRELIKVHIS